MSAHRGENVPLVKISTPRRVAGLIVASAALVLSAAACSSGSSAATTTDTGANAGGARNNAFTAYTACLQKNGVTITLPSGGARVRPSDGAGRPSGFPRPSGSAGTGQRGGAGFPGGGLFTKPDNVSQDVWDKAQSACASVRPSFGAGGGRGNGGNGGNGANAAYRNCMQQHGVTLGEGTSVNTADPAYVKAEAVCKVLRPTASPTPTS
jgi:hypothetical protein